ncbi:CBS domain-containing protein [Lentzea sp. NPDC102401]|uniref:CBS domain-containing protein n=1 Tax=Lentzea sp. NPDC102401 TaxID=3364128 RepID=UPI0038137DCB
MTEPTTADVMSRRVLAAAPDMPFRELVGAMIAADVSVVPVIDAVGRPVGLVSEVDLAAKLEFHGGAESPPILAGAHARSRWHKAFGCCAADLMTAPAVMVAEDMPLCLALRVLAGERMDALCVVNDRGTLVGLLTRRDALRLFLRGDDAIRGDLERQLFGAAPTKHRVVVRVAGGVVTLDGALCLRSATERAEWIAHGVAGVIAVRNNLSFDVDDLMITGL